MLVQHAYALGVSTVNVCGRAGENLTIVITAKDKRSKRTSNIYLLSPCGNKDETSSRTLRVAHLPVLCKPEAVAGQVQCELWWLEDQQDNGWER